MSHAPYRFSLLCASSLALSACLTVESVKTRDPDVDVGDGHSDGEDGDDGQPDAGTSACVDRGASSFGSLALQGLSNACPAGKVCDQGVCIAEPDCAPGVTTACRFAQDRPHGALGDILALDDYFYWLELGAFDALKNYQYDGTIVRMRPGVWEREEIATGLNFVNEWDNTKYDRSFLKGSNGWLLMMAPHDERAISIDGKRFYALPDNQTSRLACFAPDGTLFSEGKVYDEAAGKYRNLPFSFSGPCVVSNGELWASGYERTLTRMNLETSAVETDVTDDVLDGVLAVQGETALVLTRPYLSVVTLSAPRPLDARHVAQLGDDDLWYSLPFVRGNIASWRVGRNDSNRGLVLRADWTRSETPQVVAEALSAISDSLIAATDAGVAFLPQDRRAYHFVPTPAP